jgi:hypothetical protein
MRRHPMAPVNAARVSVATSGTDFIARQTGGFRSAQPRCWLLPWKITFVTQELGQRLVPPGARRTGKTPWSVKCQKARLPSPAR